MKINFMSLNKLLIGIVLVGALMLMLDALFESRTSQKGSQSQLAEPQTPTSAATPAPTEKRTPTPTATPETVERIILSPTFAEQPSIMKYLYFDEVMAIEGRTLAQVDIPGVTADSLFKSYRVEEFDLPESITVKIDGTKTDISVAWRLTIKGGPFRVGAQPWVIWIDDVQLGWGWAKINEDLSEITAVVVDRSLLRDGGTIFASYGYWDRCALGKLELNDQDA